MLTQLRIIPSSYRWRYDHVIFTDSEGLGMAWPGMAPRLKFSFHSYFQNLIKLRNAGWDRFKKENGTEYQLAPKEVTVTKEDKVKAAKKVQPPPKKESTNLIKTDVKNKPAVNRCISEINEPVNFLDSWETAPWGEHVDPLSALPTILAGQTSLEPSDTSFMVPLTTNFVSLSIGKSATSSRNISPDVSISSLPTATNNEINAKALFSQYEKKDSKPQQERIDWLRQKLKGKSGQCL